MVPVSWEVLFSDFQWQRWLSQGCTAAVIAEIMSLFMIYQFTEALLQVRDWSPLLDRLFRLVLISLCMFVLVVL